MLPFTAQKLKFSTKDFFSKCDQIRGKLKIWSHFLKKSLMKNFIFLCSDLTILFQDFGKDFRKTVHFDWVLNTSSAFGIILSIG